MKSWPHYNDNGFTLRNSLFGDVKLTKNPYLNEYFYSGNGITFDAAELIYCQVVGLVRS